jgi:hypothetical protein
MASSGIGLGAWDYLRWKDIQPIERQGKVAAAKIIVYAGDDEEYFSFLTSEAYTMNSKNGCSIGKIVVKIFMKIVGIRQILH